MTPRLKFLSLAGAMFLLSGCERYVARPLQSDAMIASVERRRRLPDLAKAPADASDLEAFDAMPKVEAHEFTFPRAVLIDALDTELLLRGAWTDLEQAVGYPADHVPRRIRIGHAAAQVGVRAYSPPCPECAS